MLEKTMSILGLGLLVFIVGCKKTFFQEDAYEKLSVYFADKRGGVEVGGPFVGAEFHQSNPLPSRISFYYPIANSIDLSTDYWKHALARRPFWVGVRVDNGQKKWIGREPFEYHLTPFSVDFWQSKQDYDINFRYQFCKDLPAMVVAITITNRKSNQAEFEIYTHLETGLRTCHSYFVRDSAWSEFVPEGTALLTNNRVPDTKYAQVFVLNTGLQPESWSTDARDIIGKNPETGWWITKDEILNRKLLSKENPNKPITAYIYKKTLRPGKSVQIIQIIGSCEQRESRELLTKLRENWRKDIRKFEEMNYKYIAESGLETGDPDLDKTTRWSKSILATNAHWLDGEILPMPCPAEYNFYFTHDVLVTDIGAVHYDIQRVKQDLQYIMIKADSDKRIPHAYYWKDGEYQTEICSSDDWVHLWFILLSAAYLRHSGDIEFMQQLYPYVEKSVSLMLENNHDGIMWATSPDWWDIGSTYGPRAYIMILMIRALRDFSYVSAVLGKSSDKLLQWETTANNMEKKLVEKLWDDKLHYLINYNKGEDKDEHLYCGSILAVVFDLLPQEKADQLLQTVRKQLYDVNIGVRNAFPEDFIEPEVIKYFGFEGEQAGLPGIYFNGGVWPQSTIWYIEALLSRHRVKDAYAVLKRNYTLKGITDSPNGQPALYETRKSNPNSEEYGMLDKPSFLWAGGWYLKALYYLLGVKDSPWNISLNPRLDTLPLKPQYDVYLNGTKVRVRITGQGNYLKNILCDGRKTSSAVVPGRGETPKDIQLMLGSPSCPYLQEANLIIWDVRYSDESKSITIKGEGFVGHTVKLSVVSLTSPKRIEVDGEDLKKGISSVSINGVVEVDITFQQKNADVNAVIYF